MRCLRLLLLGGVVFALAGPAGAVTTIPLPSNGNMSIDAFGAYSEIFIETGDNPIAGLPANSQLNDVAIGWSEDIGGGVADFVLYKGALSSTGAAPTAPGTVIATGTSAIENVFKDGGDTRGRLYVGGVLQSITTTDSVAYNKGGISGTMDTNPNPQLTFSVYNGYVEDLALAPGTVGVSGGQILTDFVLSGADGEEVHLDIWADDTPDATLGQVTGSAATAGKRYVGVPAAGSARPELPVRDNDGDTDGDGFNDVPGTLMVDINDGTYYDRGTTGTPWEEIAFAGDPADDDHVFWSFLGNPDSLFRVNESFTVGPGESFTDPVSGITVFTSGPSLTVDPTVGPGFSIVGQFNPGASLVTTAGKTDAGGVGFGNHLLADDYVLTAGFRFGGSITGAYDSDPNTFTFQQGEPGSVGTLTQLEGTLIPEPVTMAGMFLGLGSLVGYVRKRRK